MFVLCVFFNGVERCVLSVLDRLSRFPAVACGEIVLHSQALLEFLDWAANSYPIVGAIEAVAFSSNGRKWCHIAVLC